MGKSRRPVDVKNEDKPKLRKHELDLSRYKPRDGRGDQAIRDLERKTRFHIPESVTIIGRKILIKIESYNLDLQDIPSNTTMEEGTADFCEGTITIRLFYLKDGKCLTNTDNLVVTLLHELIHWQNEMVGAGDMPNEEKFTRQTSEVLYQIMSQVVK